MSIPDKPTPLNLSSCTALESLKIPIWPFAEIIFPHMTPLRLTKIVLEWDGAVRWDRTEMGAWGAIEKQLYSLAKRYNRAHPGKKMVLEIQSGPFTKRCERVRVLRILTDKEFMVKLKEEAELVINC